MKQISRAFLPLVLFGAISVIAQSTPQTPTPSPELKKQDFFVGEWTLEGKTIASSFGPGGQMPRRNRLFCAICTMPRLFLVCASG
jgi:hypothetical protein